MTDRREQCIHCPSARSHIFITLSTTNPMNPSSMCGATMTHMGLGMAAIHPKMVAYPVKHAPI